MLKMKYLLLICEAARDHGNVPTGDSMEQARRTAVAIEQWLERRGDAGDWSILTASRDVSRNVAELFWEICAVGHLRRNIEVTSELPPRMDLTAQDPDDYAHAVLRIYHQIEKQDLGGVTTCAFVLERDVLNNLLSEFYRRQFGSVRSPPRMRLEPAEAYLVVIETKELVEFHGA